ncbi:Lectin C-type domain-containing protein [Lachnospiraceae bacterium KH1T2]|nr:Lectin C-type domain-containing protein [Lachnospiraceae bacterium KH1T2]
MEKNNSKVSDIIKFGGAIILVIVAFFCASLMIKYDNAAEPSSESSAELESVSEDQVSENVAETVESTETEEEEVPEEQWIKDYRGLLKKTDSDNFDNYAVIYVDDDDVPEIVMLGDKSRIYTWHDGMLSDMAIDANSMYFYERGNKLFSDEKFYHIEDMEWKELVESQDEVDGEISKVISKIDGTYSYKELTAMLKKGEVTPSELSKENLTPDDESGEDTEDDEEDDEDDEHETFDADDDEIHSYEFVIGDISWTGAFDAVKGNGENRYLARITSKEEFDYVSKLIKQQNLQNYIFWLGAGRKADTEEYHWIDNFENTSEQVISNSGVYGSFWANGEPSFSGKGENTDNVEENYVCMYYDASKDAFVWSDIPDKILSTSPSYAGRLGYIVEVEK